MDGTIRGWRSQGRGLVLGLMIGAVSQVLLPGLLVRDGVSLDQTTIVGRLERLTPAGACVQPDRGELVCQEVRVPSQDFIPQVGTRVRAVRIVAPIDLQGQGAGIFVSIVSLAGEGGRGGVSIPGNPSPP